jgi:DNA polymerase-3 subunit delta'
MIGQEHLLAYAQKLIDSGFPRFVILVGARGSGKTTLTRQLCEALHYKLVSVGNTVDEVRDVIANSYNNTEPIVYVLTDTDKMSVAAKNALLKVTEEPPQKAYFIQTVTDLSNSLPTLVSRACILKMDPYTYEQLRQYLETKYPQHQLSAEQLQFICETATVPLEVDMLMSYDVQDFINFVNTTANHLHTVNSANAFKIENKLALKKDEDKWDVVLFLQALNIQLLALYYTTRHKPFYEAFKLVCDTIIQIKVKNSVNKQYCLDQLIIGIRKCWREE